MLLGFEEERFVKRTTDTAKLGLIDSSVGDSSSATTPSSIGGTGEEFTSRSYFGRINYAFDSKWYNIIQISNVFFYGYICSVFINNFLLFFFAPSP